MKKCGTCVWYKAGLLNTGKCDKKGVKVSYSDGGSCSDWKKK